MLRDGVTGDWIGTFAGHKGAVWSAKLDPMGYLAATASGDFSVRLWDAITGKCLHQFPHKHIVKSVDFSPDSKLLATGGHEGKLRIFNLLDCVGLGAANKDEIIEIEPMTAFDQSNETKITITKCLWWGNSKVLAAGSDGKIRVWDVKSGTLSYTITTVLDAEVRDMEIKRIIDGDNGGETIKLIVAAGKNVLIFDLKDYRQESNFDMPIHFKDEGGVSLHPDGTKFIAGGSDLWVRVFDSKLGNELECLKGHHGPIRCLRYAFDGKTFASGSEDGTIRIWKS